jgi:hypothetical protein
MPGEKAVTHPAIDIATGTPPGKSDLGLCQRTERLGVGRTGAIGTVGQLADDRKRPVQGGVVVVTMVPDGEIVTTDGALLLHDSRDLLRKKRSRLASGHTSQDSPHVGRGGHDLLYTAALTPS